jgi:tetratricopeptide (TPR) repeat protein
VEDRGTLCESQRALAEVLLEQGRIDEAERFALASRETVGPEDVASRATTRKALARVRAAQRRDAEAEKLYRDALDIIQGSDYERQAGEIRNALARFLRDRGRHAEARSYDYSAPSTVPIARVDRSSGDSEITVAGRSKR